jgi:hypothetical protein
MEVVSDCLCRRGRKKDEVFEVLLVRPEFLVVAQVSEVDLAEDPLESDVLVGVLFYYVGLRLLDVVADVPHVQRGAAPHNQPHLILIKISTRPIISLIAITF